jgi:hypothetical protein
MHVAPVGSEGRPRVGHHLEPVGLGPAAGRAIRILSRGRCVLPQELYCAVRADDLGDLDASAQAAGPDATPRLLCAAGACRVAILVIRLTRRVRAGPLSSP